MGTCFFTIGFTKKNAKEFFSILSSAGIRRVIDIRLNNQSQLAGFTKRDDLKFFLKEICGADYIHVPQAAPTEEILNAYKNGELQWQGYVDKFLPLIRARGIESILTPEVLEGGCLLCSEPTPEKCHRRLVAEYLQSKHGGMSVKHL